MLPFFNSLSVLLMKFKDIEYEEKPIFPHKEKRVHMVDRAAIITVNDGHHHQEIFLNKNDLHARRGGKKKLISFQLLMFNTFPAWS